MGAIKDVDTAEGAGGAGPSCVLPLPLPTVTIHVPVKISCWFPTGSDFAPQGALGMPEGILNVTLIVTHGDGGLLLASAW